MTTQTTTSALEHEKNLIRSLLALTGVSIGDSFGECFFNKGCAFEPMDFILQKQFPKQTNPAWATNFTKKYTDDAEMALAIVELLHTLAMEQSGDISLQHSQARLAWLFAKNFHLYGLPFKRSYGGGARVYLEQVYKEQNGDKWQEYSSGMFEGKGSYGNGAAMRVAPLGAYFASYGVERVVQEALLSGQVTHWNVEGQHGGVAIALASMYACTVPKQQQNGPELFDFVIKNMPAEESETKTNIAKAKELFAIPTITVLQAVAALGNGEKVSSQDTVPFCLWCIAKHMHDYEQAMWTCVEALGDRDTTCAIVGGVVALSAGLPSIPAQWLADREPLKVADWKFALPTALQQCDKFETTLTDYTMHIEK